LSRPRSARGANPSGSTRTARPAGGARGVFVQTPKSDIFVALLGVGLGAMALGCLLLLLVLNRYGFSTKVSAINATPTAAVALATGHLGKIDTVRL
jgi:hypothetical protein